MNIKNIIAGAALALTALVAPAQNNVAEEVAWVIGDTPIWKSEIEEQFQNMRYENQEIVGDPYCFIPEQMAIQKLFIHQAELDTIEANESQVVSRADSQINFLISQLGSREKVEQYFHKSMPELRQHYMDMIRNESRVMQVQQALTKDVKSTPSDIRRYFSNLPADSIPYVPQQVEVQIITMNPVIPREEIEDVKARLRKYSEAVNNGESEFSALAILYSEDGSSMRGGELGFMSRASLDPDFAAVAFNLNDPKKVSRIVESQFGYHIIQLIEKRGDRINCRHILLRPRVPVSELTIATERMDSLRNLIMEGKATFDEAAMVVSQDKDTRANKGLMVNPATRTTRFEMSQLPQEVAKQVANLEEGELSKAFLMTDETTGKEIVAMVRLARRIEGHKADLRNDYLQIKEMYEAAERNRIISEWIEKKIRETYVRIEEGYRNCDFRYKAWIREREGDEQTSAN
ncbi:MAG: peptidylprolyl isomerase [Pseudoflavonifractor sp.]|nr:peptidylprolyl isomerase [Alloprevotella sp.]MCM1116456.1 peptidylprolyl isomerase [Pseudoflavonifractor sp.]